MEGEQTSQQQAVGEVALGPPPQQLDLATALRVFETPVVLQTDGTATSKATVTTGGDDSHWHLVAICCARRTMSPRRPQLPGAKHPEQISSQASPKLCSAGSS